MAIITEIFILVSIVPAKSVQNSTSITKRHISKNSKHSRGIWNISECSDTLGIRIRFEVVLSYSATSNNKSPINQVDAAFGVTTRKRKRKQKAFTPFAFHDFFPLDHSAGIIGVK